MRKWLCASELRIRKIQEGNSLIKLTLHEYSSYRQCGIQFLECNSSEIYRFCYFILTIENRSYSYVIISVQWSFKSMYDIDTMLVPISLTNLIIVDAATRDMVENSHLKQYYCFPRDWTSTKVLAKDNRRCWLKAFSGTVICLFYLVPNPLWIFRVFFMNIYER